MTEHSLMILKFLAEGCTVEEVFWHYPQLSYQDIAQAAQEAVLRLQNTTPSPQTSRMASIKDRYPKAFAKWMPEEELLLMREFQAGQDLKALSVLLNRQPGAIRIRLEKLGLLEADERTRRRFPL